MPARTPTASPRATSNHLRAMPTSQRAPAARNCHPASPPSCAALRRPASAAHAELITSRCWPNARCRTHAAHRTHAARRMVRGILAIRHTHSTLHCTCPRAVPQPPSTPRTRTVFVNTALRPEHVANCSRLGSAHRPAQRTDTRHSMMLCVHIGPGRPARTPPQAPGRMWRMLQPPILNVLLLFIISCCLLICQGQQLIRRRSSLSISKVFGELEGCPLEKSGRFGGAGPSEKKILSECMMIGEPSPSVYL